MKRVKTRDLHVLIGVALFILCLMLLPRGRFSWEGRVALSTITVMIYWWITQPVHIAVTALLPIAVNSIFKIASMDSVLAEYFNATSVLLLGANLIILAWIKTGLSKRIALRVLILIGTGVKKQMILWFLFSSVLSMFLPNTVVAAALCPIAAAMVRYGTEDPVNPAKNRMLFLILLAIVWGAGIGGFGTPLGGAMNLVAIEHIEAFLGREYLYVTWTLHMLPYLLLLTGGICAFLLSIRTDKTDRVEASRFKSYFKEELKKIGKPKKGEIFSLALFCAAVMLAFLRPLYQDFLPGLLPPFAFLILGLLVFFFNDENRERLLTWDYAVKQINWGLIILFSGGMAVGGLLVSSGAADATAAILTDFQDAGLFGILLIVIAFGVLLSNASSNTAATAILVPIVISIAAAKSVSPLPLIYLAAVSCNCAFVLPTSIRAIAVGYGLDVRFMLKKGLAAVVITIALLSAAAYVLCSMPVFG
jgi:sodium-dependent dicarboxylate transporter 2/3/5